MPSLFTIESHESHKPTLLLYGTPPELYSRLIELYQTQFNIIVLSQTIEQTGIKDGVYYISKESYYLIDRLVNTIDYALFFVDSHVKALISTIHTKLQKDITKVLYLVAQRDWHNAESLIPHREKELIESTIFFGDFITKTNTPQSSTVTQFIHHALEQKRIELYGNDLTPLYAVGIDDAIIGINQCVFGNTQREHCYFLFYSHPQTYISATHLLKRIEPDLQISVNETDPIIKKDSPLIQLTAFIQKEYGTPPLSLEKYLAGFEATAQEIADIVPKEIPPKQPFSMFALEHAERKPKRVWFSFWTTSLLIGLIGFIVIQSFFAAIGGIYAYQAKQAMTSGNIEQTLPLLKTSEEYAQVAYPLITILLPVLNTVTPYNSLHDIQLFHEVTMLTQDSMALMTPTGEFPTINIRQLKVFISTLLSVYSRVQAEQAEGHALIKLTNVPEGFTKILNILNITPELLGNEHEKRYLLLFQDNGELRATGGFIGSVGEISADHGKISNIAIDDVYNVDGQLKTPIEPYYIIRRYLEPQLFLRDSNFNPNFEYSASTSAMLYNMSIHHQVDGVIAIDFETIRRIIQVVGPVQLPSYHITITQDNAFKFLQNTIQSNAFPGSQEKKDILTALKNALFVKLSQNQELYTKVGMLIPSLLTEKHIMVALQDKSLENAFSAEGLSGNNLDLRNKQNILPDVLSINESNIGVNKANISVNRKVFYDVSLNPNHNLVSRVTIMLHNAGTEDYKSYIRILTPANSNTASITINGATQSIIPAITDPKIYEGKGFKTPTGFELDETNEDNYHFFGFVTTVPKNSTQKIEFDYTNGIATQDQASYNYSLLYFKQPGTENYPLTFIMHFDKSYGIHNAIDATASDTSIQVKRTVNQDQEIQFQIIKR